MQIGLGQSRSALLASYWWECLDQSTTALVVLTGSVHLAVAAALLTSIRAPCNYCLHPGH